MMHVACVAVFFVDVNTTAVVLCAVAYFIRMFGITAGYHRYFSHRTYKTSRPFQFFLAWLGCSAMQKGPLWWAGHHRDHHRHSDSKDDPHSPIAYTFWYSHVGWVLAPQNEDMDPRKVRDLMRYPELRWLNREHWIPGLTLAVICYLIGGLSGLVWGFFVSTVILYHAVFTVNSICHLFGSKRYKTNDESRNNLLVALLTLGEGWHNNHHYYQSSANQGFFWYEIDISYYIIRMLGWAGVVWDIRTPDRKRKMTNRKKRTTKTRELVGAGR